MSEDDVSQLKKLKLNRVGSLITVAVGLILLAYMVTVEDEPGALPLAMLLAGAAWYVATRRRMRAWRG